MTIAAVLAAPRLRAAGLFLLVLAAWELLARSAGGPVAVVPWPTAIVGAILAKPAFYLDAAQPTLIAAALGLAAGTAFAWTLAAIFARSRAAEEVLYNLVVILHGLPFLAIIPLLVIWLGNGLAPKVVIAALATFFPVLVNATRGLKAADAAGLDLFRLLDATWTQEFFKLRIPTCLPYAFAGLKIAAPGAILGATIAEWIGSRYGLGAMILNAMFNFDVVTLWAMMLVCTIIALAAFGMFVLLEKATVGRWAQPESQE